MRRSFLLATVALVAPLCFATGCRKKATPLPPAAPLLAIHDFPVVNGQLSTTTPQPFLAFLTDYWGVWVETEEGVKWVKENGVESWQLDQISADEKDLAEIETSRSAIARSFTIRLTPPAGSAAAPRLFWVTPWALRDAKGPWKMQHPEESFLAQPAE